MLACRTVHHRQKSAQALLPMSQPFSMLASLLRTVNSRAQYSDQTERRYALERSSESAVSSMVPALRWQRQIIRFQ